MPPFPADEDEDLALWNAGPPRKAPVPPPDSSDSSSEDENDGASGGEAGQRLRDFEEIRGTAAVALPSVDAAFEAVTGRPVFLDPEATRQLPTLVRQSPADAADAAEESVKGKAWDISHMAPKMKEAEGEQPGVIAAKGVRYREDDGGGLTPVLNLGEAKPARDRGKATPAMKVNDFMEKGVGGAQLPRKRQERKDREQQKRMKGQSTHASWKSEAEMAMRQQYD